MKNNTEEKNSAIEKVLDETETLLRPRICCIDIEDDVIENLKKEKFNVQKGTFGYKINVPNKTNYNSHSIQHNINFPQNLHEYDVFILDLNYSKVIDYIPSEHKRTNITGTSYSYLQSKFPETVFDPRPLGSYLFGEELKKISNRPYLVIAFSTSEYSVQYNVIHIKGQRIINEEEIGKNIYSFLYDINNIIFNIIKGKELYVENMRNDLKTLLEKYKENSNYNQTFQLPTNWENGKRKIDPAYLPLFTNSNNDIVSYAVKEYNFMIFILPQIKDKQNFLLEFLTNIAPDLIPEIFPFSTQFSWKKQKDYWLPNYSILIEQKDCIEKEFEEKIKSKELEIENNTEKYSFLHDLIIETGDNLVEAVQKYFMWLGYKNVRIMDNEETESEIKEEDIQIDHEDGILIIEVKGIGGTSIDSECSQIAKIKHRRCKERKSFDVYAMYLVNHQRYLPPLNRKNPPFTEHQVKDAINDERGLLTTWQLFNLYFEIEKGIITKEEVKKKLLKYGLIEFKPENLVFVDEPKEFFKNKQVCIVNLKDVNIKINDELIVEKNGRFDKVIVKEIMMDDKPVGEIDNGEVGIKLDKKIMKKSKIWKRSQS